MERRRLGRTGIAVPVIGTGTRRGFDVKDRRGLSRCTDLAGEAIDQGAELFDTSPMYGEAERVLARSLGERRDRALVATKVWARTRAVGEAQIEQALADFGRVDLYFVHNLLAFRDHKPLLDSLVERGRAGAVGGSHYLPSGIPEVRDLVAEGAIAAAEVPYHPLAKDAEAELFPEAAANDAGIVVMQPFGGGRLLENPPSEGALARLRPFGIETWPQAILKWILSDPRVCAVIPGTSKREHLRENAAAGGPPWLDDDERAYIADLAAQCVR